MSFTTSGSDFPFKTKKKTDAAGRLFALSVLIFCLVFLQIFIRISMKKFNTNFLKYWYLVRKRFLESQGWYFACLESLDTIIPVLCYHEGRNTQALCTTNSCNSSAMPRSRRVPILVWFKNFLNYWYLVRKLKLARKQFLESQGWHFSCLESLDTIIPVVGWNTQALCTTNWCNSSAMPWSNRMPILVWFCKKRISSLKYLPHRNGDMQQFLRTAEIFCKCCI